MRINVEWVLLNERKKNQAMFGALGRVMSATQARARNVLGGRSPGQVVKGGEDRTQDRSTIVTLND